MWFFWQSMNSPFNKTISGSGDLEVVELSVLGTLSLWCVSNIPVQMPFYYREGPLVLKFFEWGLDGEGRPTILTKFMNGMEMRWGDVCVYCHYEVPWLCLQILHTSIWLMCWICLFSTVISIVAYRIGRSPLLLFIYFSSVIAWGSLIFFLYYL